MVRLAAAMIDRAPEPGFPVTPGGGVEGRAESRLGGGQPGANQLYLREEELRDAVELIHFAAQALSDSAAAPLANRDLGRLHQRALSFIGRHAPLAISDLLAILGASKQTVSRVVAELVERGLVHQRVGQTDRRQRLLGLTPAGRDLERLLWERQRAVVAAAYRAAGGGAVEGFRRVLAGMVTDGPGAVTASGAGDHPGRRRTREP